MVAAAVSGAFAFVLARRFAAWRSRAVLFWCLSLLCFFAASLAMALGVVAGWSAGTFRVFYLFGAVLTVPWLAMGSVQVNMGDPVTCRAAGVGVLLAAVASAVPAATGTGAPPGVFLGAVVLGGIWGLLLLLAAGEGLAAGSLALVTVFSGLGALAVTSTPLLGAMPGTGFPEGRELLGAVPRAFAFAGNTVGAVLVIVAAVAAVLRRSRGGRRVWGQLVIAGGVLVASAGGALSFLGDTAGNAVALAIGVSVMFAGFSLTVASPHRATIRPPGGADAG